jgi:hypothetical protein
MATIVVNGVTINVDEGSTVTIGSNGSVTVNGSENAPSGPVIGADSSVDKAALFDGSILGKYDVTFKYKSKSGHVSTVSGAVYPVDVEYLDGDDRLAHVKTDDGWRSFLESGVQGDLLAFDRAGGEQELVNTESVTPTEPGVLFDRLESDADHPYLTESKIPVKVKKFTYCNQYGVEKMYRGYEFYPDNLFKSPVDGEPSIRAEKDGAWKSFRRDGFTGCIEIVE